MQATTIVLHGMIILQASWKQSDSTSCVRKLQLPLRILYVIYNTLYTLFLPPIQNPMRKMFCINLENYSFLTLFQLDLKFHQCKLSNLRGWELCRLLDVRSGVILDPKSGGRKMEQVIWILYYIIIIIEVGRIVVFFISCILLNKSWKIHNWPNPKNYFFCI